MKAPARFLLLLALLPLLAGCWDDHPLNERAITLGLGIAPGPGGSLIYTLVQQTALTPSSSGTTASGPPSLNYTAVSAPAPTLSQALATLQPTMARLIDLNQLTLVVLSDRLNPAQLQNAVEDLSNMNTLDQNSFLAVADSPRRIVSYQNSLEIPPVYFPARMFACTGCQDFNARVLLWQFYVRLHTPGATIWLPLLKVTKDHSLTISGVALYRAYRFAGELTGPALEGFAYGNGLETRDTLSVPSGGRLISLENITSSRRISLLTVPNGGVPAFRLQIRATGAVDSTSPFNPQISRRADDGIRREVEATISDSRRFGVDPFGFGEYLAWANPTLFHRLGDWNSAYRRAKVQVTVNLSYYAVPGLALNPKL